MIGTHFKPSEAAPCTRGLLVLRFGVCILTQRSEVPQWRGFQAVLFSSSRRENVTPGQGSVAKTDLVTEAQRVAIALEVWTFPRGSGLLRTEYFRITLNT